jgi:hypothetical protein
MRLATEGQVASEILSNRGHHSSNQKGASLASKHRRVTSFDLKVVGDHL